MKTRYTIQVGCSIGLIIMLFQACKDDFKLPAIDVLYELEVSGNQVKFNNSTVGGSSYRWEFGDGETSIEENPTHIYPGKGKYVATLYVTAGNGEIVEGSTVIRISKSSPIKMDDNSLADWDTITANIIQPGNAGGIIEEIKLDYDGNYIYLYGSLATKVANEDIFDFYIDSDDNIATGLLTGTFTEGAYDILLEGPILSGNMDIFYHTGEQSDFSFDTQSISEAYSLGTVAENAKGVRFEMRIDRTKLKNLTGKGMRLGINVVKNDWSASIGFAPAEGDPAFYLNMED
ncbi:PKD domain-containing protein [Olivibacter domesticus]|nr:PKD domain-containing protein [Olivibacter domesticus]